MPDPFVMPSSWDRPPTGSPYPQPPKKKRWPWFAGGGVALIAALVALGSTSTDDTENTADVKPAQSSSATSTSTTTVTSTSATVEAPAATATPAAQISTAVAASAALEKLDTLPVKGRAPKTGYDRGQFGQTWTDNVTVEGGHNGCDTRNDILRRDLVSITIKPGSQGCTVTSGTLNDPYTNTSVNFLRGETTSSAAQIDHVVALSNAWQTGAQQLTLEKRTDLANDPRNLQATDGPTNQQKSDGDAATWLPPNKSYRCTYVARQVDVKAAYDLWVTPPEKDAITRVLTDCGAASSTPSTTITTVDVPESTTQTPIPVAPQTATPVYTPAPTPEYTPPPPAPVVDAPSSTYYQNCTAVRAAGAAPIYAGQPGYSSKLDRDGDGVACE
ncbi:UNVERIFIED_CONTAM: excalibur calcium-binding domain-containing protein [Williamsia faeni]